MSPVQPGNAPVSDVAVFKDFPFTQIVQLNAKGQKNRSIIDVLTDRSMRMPSFSALAMGRTSMNTTPLAPTRVTAESMSWKKRRRRRRRRRRKSKRRRKSIRCGGGGGGGGRALGVCRY